MLTLQTDDAVDRALPPGKLYRSAPPLSSCTEQIDCFRSKCPAALAPVSTSGFSAVSSEMASPSSFVCSWFQTSPSDAATSSLTRVGFELAGKTQPEVVRTSPLTPADWTASTRLRRSGSRRLTARRYLREN